MYNGVFLLQGTNCRKYYVSNVCSEVQLYNEIRPSTNNVTRIVKETVQ